MFINASPDSRSLDRVDLRYIFTFLGYWMSAHIQLTLSATCTKGGSRCGCWERTLDRMLRVSELHCKLNRYHNDVHCTYCKHRTKRRISGIESPLHSCWDKITVKNRRGAGGPLAREGGSGTPGTFPWLRPCRVLAVFILGTETSMQK